MKGQAQDSVIYENLIKCNNYSMNSNWFSRTKKTFVNFGKFGDFSIKFLIPQMTLVFTHWDLNGIKARVHLIVGFIGGLNDEQSIHFDPNGCVPECVFGIENVTFVKYSLYLSWCLQKGHKALSHSHEQTHIMYKQYICYGHFIETFSK